MDLPAPFGKYELLERIAAGGMAEVFLARSFGVAGFEKRLVIKRIRAEYAQDPRFVALFVNEAKIGVHLNHPNVVQTYDLGKVGSSYYIAMEHLHGRDLNRLKKALAAQERRLPQAIAVSIVAEMCRGLGYAHTRASSSGVSLGLVHRDVSPHNVVVTFDGEVKLVDFGIARLMNAVDASGAPLPATVSSSAGRPGGGKYAYMSPEQAHGEDVDHRSDLFSAGIVLWELLVGRRLFQDPDPAEKLRRVQEAVVPDPRDLGVPIDEVVAGILRRALAKDRADRYPSAQPFEEDLRAWLFSRGEPAGRPEIGALLREAFPGEADRPSFEAEVARVVADVERLDAPLAADNGAGSGEEDVGPALVGERKGVVAMFIDVDGLTVLSEQVEPEALFRAHYALLRWLGAAVARFGGVLYRSVDDLVQVLFGVPRTRADDAARALDLAIELQRKVGDLRARGLDLRLSIGVHAGEVTLSPGPKRLRYQARGNTTRLARRLSALADHGQVLVSDRIIALCSVEFRFHKGPDLSTRGGRPSDASFLLEGRRRGLRVRGHGPWMRRAGELDVLRGALLDVARGQGRCVLLSGAEGSGKSRLVREIRDLAVRRGLPVHLGRCLPYADAGESFPDLLVDVLGLDPEPPAAEIAGRFQRLAQLGLSAREIDVLRVAYKGADPRDKGADARDAHEPDEQWLVLAKVVGGLAHDGPVIVALEDVQHVPERHIARLRRFVQAVARAPVLLLLTWRGVPGDAVSALGLEVTLGALGAAAQRRLVCALLDVASIDPRLAELIERSCEGNPLYIEEMVKFLVNGARIDVRDGEAQLVEHDGDLPIPATLAGVVAARIDRLDPAAKGALQLAAVIGNPFSSALLAESAGLVDPSPILAELIGHGLVNAPVAGGGDQWSFAGELVQRATLRGILGVQRRESHRLVAAAMERVDPEHRDYPPEVLAVHCAAGGRLLDAARFAYRAGERLERAHALERARASYERGLGWVREERDRADLFEARVQGEAMLSLRLGIVSLLMGDSRRGEKSLQLALDIASDAGISWVEVRAHVELGRSYLQRGRLELASAHLQQARDLLKIDPDAELDLEVTDALALLAYERGDNEEAERQWNAVLSQADVKPAAAARCLSGLANRHMRARQWDHASAFLEAAERAARDAQDKILEGRVLNNMGLLHSSAGRYDMALACFRRALELREGIGYLRGVVVNHHNIGDVHFIRCDWARAAVAFERSREIAAEAGWERGVVLNEGYLGYLDAVHGREAEGLARIGRAVEDARRLGDLETSVTAEWLAARWLMERGRSTEARQRLADARGRAERLGLKTLLGEMDRLTAG